MTARAAIASASLSPRVSLGRLLAKGAVCEVFKGHHLALDIPVAVKVLRQELCDESRYRDRMRLEAQVLPRVQGPHIVHCFDSGVTPDSRPYIVLELLRGPTLDRLVTEMQALDELTAIHWTCELLAALDTVHAQGLVHRDVGPKNIIVHQPDHEPVIVRLIDFGFVKVLPDAPVNAPEPLSIPTDPDDAVGTPRFTAPEVAQNMSTVDRRADIYSAGVVLYWMLTGRDPYNELATPAEVLEAHVYEPPPPPRRFASQLAPELERIVLKMLEKDPADRFDSAKHAARALRECEARISEALRRVLVPTPSRGEEGGSVVELDRMRHPGTRHVLRPGESCGPYTIERLIDAGGFSEVYAATQKRGLARRVAIKVLKKSFATDARMRERFRTEMNLLASIRHPNMVTVFQAGEHDGTWWMAMELLSGINLRQHIRRHGPMPLLQALKCVRQVAGAIREAHRLGILHRDLKPDNVFITHLGDACVVDAGLAKLVVDAQRRSSRHITGTVAYMSPEALTGMPLDARSDIYSLGHVFFEMVTGRHAYAHPKPPHALPEMREMTLYHLHRAIPRRKEVAPDCPPAVWDLIAAMTRKRPEQRPTNMDDVCRALDGAVDELRGGRRGTGARSRPTSGFGARLSGAVTSEIKRHPTVLALLCGIPIGLVMGLLVFRWVLPDLGTARRDSGPEAAAPFSAQRSAEPAYQASAATSGASPAASDIVTPLPQPAPALQRKPATPQAPAEAPARPVREPARVERSAPRAKPLADGLSLAPPDEDDQPPAPRTRAPPKAAQERSLIY